MKPDLSAGWTVERDGRAAEPVTLPHDAMTHERRDPHVPSGPPRTGCRRPAGRDHGFAAVFPVRYAPGELVAVALDGSGEEIARSVLRSASDGVRLRLSADRSAMAAGEQDLAFVRVSLADDRGVVVPASGVALTAAVTGAASLVGFGSADPRPPHGVAHGFGATFHGEALAVVRSGREPGAASLTMTSDGYGQQTIDLAGTSPRNRGAVTLSTL